MRGTLADSPTVITQPGSKKWNKTTLITIHEIQVVHGKCVEM